MWLPHDFCNSFHDAEMWAPVAVALRWSSLACASALALASSADFSTSAFAWSRAAEAWSSASLARSESFASFCEASMSFSDVVIGPPLVVGSLSAPTVDATPADRHRQPTQMPGHAVAYDARSSRA